ncbi:hypothetical protein DL769_008828 [Monosporascus sp. CRB-8-3]|nr:hypothetical protein DL769_008828 [Monosporascus sp. CRB-8-3]
MKTMDLRELDRATLEKNSIFFYEKRGEYGQVPAHVNSLRDALLDFGCTLSERLSLYDDDQFEAHEMLHSVMDRLFVSNSERDSIVHSIQKYRKMKHDAQKLDDGCDREAEWVKFYEKNFLDKLCDEFEITDQDSRRVARAKFYYDDFDVSAKERPWGLFGGPGDFRKEYGKADLTTPIPDWVAYFRVYDLESSWSTIPNSSSRWHWANSAKDSIVENFSLATLKELAEHGLQFSATNILPGNRKSSIVPSDLLCYPWLITEYKRKEKQEDVGCYCQAANAGAASLMLLQTLNMVCVWEGDMNRIVHMVELQAILENTHTWAMRVLRPWISHQIDQWKFSCHTGRRWEQEKNAGNELGDQFDALFMANPFTKIVNELQDGDSVQEMEYSEPEMFSVEQLSQELHAELDELFGTRRVLSNTERLNKRPSSQTRSISTQTDADLEIRPEKTANHNIPGRNQMYTPENKSDSVNSERLSLGSSVLFDIPGGPQNALGQPSYSDQLDSSDEIRSPSRAESPVPRQLCHWKEFDSPISAGITRYRGHSTTGGLYNGYPYLNFEKGEVFDIWGLRDSWYLARRRIGRDNPKGWIWAAACTLVDAKSGRSLETTSSRIHKPDLTDSLTEANETPEPNKSESGVLEKGPSSPACQRSQTTASLETKGAGRRNLGPESVAVADMRIRPKFVRFEKTGYRIRIKLPDPPAKERRVSIEFFDHPPRAAYTCTGEEVPGSRREDGPPPVIPPDLASFSKEPSTSAAEHGSGTDVSADQSQSPPPHKRQKVGLFEQSNRGHFEGGLFAGLDTNGWKPSSISSRDEERQLWRDAGPSKPTREEPFCWCPSPSDSQQKGLRPSDPSQTPVKASLSNVVKTSAPTTPGLFGNINASKYPKQNSASDEKQTSTPRMGLFSSDSHTPSKLPLFEATLQAERCNSAEEDWETTAEE